MSTSDRPHPVAAVATPFPDPAQIERACRLFWGRLLDAGASGVASLRCFDNREAGGGNKPPVLIHDVPLDGPADFPRLVNECVALARLAAGRGLTFAPVLCLFDPARKATHKGLPSKAPNRHGEMVEFAFGGSDNMTAVGVVTVDADGTKGDPRDVLARCVAAAGPPLMIVESGGTWTDRDTGEVVPKVHAHWGVTPALEPGDVKAVGEARRILIGLAGDDQSAKSPVHPYRLPGSVHAKDPANPRLCRVVEEGDAAPPAPAAFLARLQPLAPPKAAPAAGPGEGQRTDDRQSGELLRDLFTGKQFHGSQVPLSMRMLNWIDELGAVEATKKIMRSVMHASEDAGSDRWASRYADIDREVDTAASKLDRKATVERFGKFELPEDAPAEGVFPPLTVEEKAEAAKPAEAGRKSVWAHEIEPVTVGRWVVKKLVPSEGYGVLYGKSQAGKTFVAVDMACRVALGLPWQGRRVKKGVVVYLAAEAPISVKNRIAGWRIHHGHKGGLPVLVIDPPFDFFAGAADAAMVADLIKVRVQEAFAAGMMPREGAGIGLIIIDTLPKTFGRGSENKAEDMNAVTENLANLGRPFGAFVMAVHHTGKDEERGPRGSYSLFAGVETSIRVEGPDEELDDPDARKIVFDKERDGDTPSFTFKLSPPVELGEDEDGDMETTCVAVEAEAPPQVGGAERVENASKGLGANQKAALRCIAETAAWPEDGDEHDAAGATIREDAARAHFLTQSGVTNGSTTRQRTLADQKFDEALTGLFGRNLVRRVPPGGLWVSRAAIAVSARETTPRRRAGCGR